MNFPIIKGSTLDKIVNYAISLSGIPYRSAGNNPVENFDCSGFVQWILRAAGIDPPGRQNAQMLYDYFNNKSTHGVFQAGSLAFYGENLNKIEHVAFMIDPYRIMECGGGDHTTLTIQDAAAHNACVRMGLVKYRKDFLETLKPSYALIGLI